MPKNFKELSERKIPALAISLESDFNPGDCGLGILVVSFHTKWKRP
jgi:hypothetical protein